MTQRLEIDPEEFEGHELVAPRRRFFPAVLMALGAVGVGYLSWWTYQHAKPPQLPSNIPVIHSDAGPVKEAPKNPGGMIVPDQDSILLNRDGKGPAKVEQLLPEPEVALPRPAPPPKPVQPPEIAAAPAKPAPSAETGAAPTPPQAAPPAAVTPAPGPPVAALPAAPSPPTAAPAPNMPRAVPAGSGYRLQLGAVRTEEAAKLEWQKLQKSQPDLLGKLALSVARVDLGEKGIFYRIQAGPIADAGEATQSCAALKSRNIGCILVKP